MILDPDRLGDQLAVMRILDDQTQRQLAARAGTHQNVISPIETGAVSPTLRTLIALLGALGHHLEIVRDSGTAPYAPVADRG